MVFSNLTVLSSHRHPYYCRYFFSYDVSLCCIQSPIGIKTVLAVFVIRSLPHFADQKTFGTRPCPLDVSGLVVVNQPLDGSRRGQ
jgi:hypothetical protein